MASILFVSSLNRSGRSATRETHQSRKTRTSSCSTSLIPLESSSVESSSETIAGLSSFIFLTDRPELAIDDCDRLVDFFGFAAALGFDFLGSSPTPTAAVASVSSLSNFPNLRHYLVLLRLPSQFFLYGARLWRFRLGSSKPVGPNYYQW